MIEVANFFVLKHLKRAGRNSLKSSFPSIHRNDSAPLVGGCQLCQQRGNTGCKGRDLTRGGLRRTGANIMKHRDPQGAQLGEIAGVKASSENYLYDMMFQEVPSLFLRPLYKEMS